MKLANIDFLQCLECAGNIRLADADVRDGVIQQGILTCAVCGMNYPVLDEVGVFFRRSVMDHYLSEREKQYLLLKTSQTSRGHGLSPEEKKQLDATTNWQYQWEKVHPFEAADLTRNPDDFLGANAFFHFVPLDETEIAGKTIYVACGGRGREAFHLSRKNPARLIVNEIGTEIYAIRQLLREWPGDLMLLRNDVCFSPLKSNVADIAICDHALQHVLDHKLGFGRLCEAVKPGGQVAICVYSHENNFFMTHLVEPSKRVVHRLPLGAQRFLAFFPALAIYTLIHALYRPVAALSRNLLRRLPLWEFMMFWSNNTFNFTWMSCFDFIHAPISYHFRRSEMEALARDRSLTIRLLQNTNSTMWSMIGQKAR